MASTVSLPRPVRAVGRVFASPYFIVMRGLEDSGEQLSFYLRSLGWFWRTIVSYKREVVRLIAEVSLGSGALALIGGSVGVVAFLTLRKSGWRAIRACSRSASRRSPGSSRRTSTPVRSRRSSRVLR
jgi:hypothetical protein